jgi:FemAB-related protein (PEP-CTERM system-associated)
MDVTALNERGESAWDEFVRQSQGSSPFQLMSWKQVMDRTYAYPSHYLMATQGGRIEGVLPLFELKSRIMGHSLTTPPGGLCAKNDEAAVALIERAKELTCQVGARYLSFRDSPQEWGGGLVSVADHYTMVRDLPARTDKLLKSFDRKVRRYVKAALKGDVDVSLGNGEYLDDFYAVYRVFLRDKGTPSFGKGFLHNVVAEFGDNLLICCIRWQGQLIGAYCAFLFGDAILGAWGAALPRYLDHRPNHMSYWAYMQYGCEHGFRHMDLGRSRIGSGSYEFKKGWGAQPQPLYQLYYIRGNSQAPRVGSSRQDDARYRLFVNLWRRLPLPLVEALGPHLRKMIPFG